MLHPGFTSYGFLKIQNNTCKYEFSILQYIRLRTFQCPETQNDMILSVTCLGTAEDDGVCFWPASNRFLTPPQTPDVLPRPPNSKDVISKRNFLLDLGNQGLSRLHNASFSLFPNVHKAMATSTLQRDQLPQKCPTNN